MPPVEILMPELGESVHEGTVSRWLKKEGEFVKEDEPVVEIMTDKVNTELPSPASGILSQILIPEGENVEVFKAMGIITPEGETGTEKPTAKPKDNQAAAAIEPPPFATKEKEEGVEGGASPKSAGRTWFSPVVRAMAKQHGLTDEQLKSINGSGSGGRVTKKDLETYLKGGTTKVPIEASRATATMSELTPLVGMRKMIADHMVKSSQVPTVSTVTQIDVTNMVRFREQNKEGFQQTYGVKLTYTPFFIKAVSEALREFPMVNSSLRDDSQIQVNQSVNLGIAVALGSKGDEGLIVPVIRGCEAKSIVEIAKDLEVIANKARTNTLKPDDVQGATFTLTNPGSYGALFGTPMISAPQAAIAGAYAIQKQPVIVDDMIAIRSLMYFVLTYDHRIIDGLLAGRFLQSVKKQIEEFAFFK